MTQHPKHAQDVYDDFLEAIEDEELTIDQVAEILEEMADRYDFIDKDINLSKGRLKIYTKDEDLANSVVLALKISTIGERYNVDTRRSISGDAVGVRVLSQEAYELKEQTKDYTNFYLDKYQPT